MLRLKHIAPSGLLCFVFLEGSIALGLLLALAELVSWWGVLVLPVMVALMVKLNDVIAGSLTRSASASSRVATAQAPVLRSAESTEVLSRVADEATTRLPGLIERDLGAPIKRPWAEKVEVQQQWIRQSATRRYE
jgi:hypothetical protein